MMQFSFDWDSTLSLGILALVVMLLPLQLWLLIGKSKPVFTGRLFLRLFLNVLLWLAVLMFVLQPYIQREHASATGVILADEVSSSFRKKLTDSLGRSEVLNINSMQDVEGLAALDTVLLVGQNFDQKVYRTLLQSESKPVLKWVPFREVNRVYGLQWKGILRRGEKQELRGNIVSDRVQTVSLYYGDQVLDSMKLGVGQENFKLSFPAFTEGRSTAVLKLEAVAVDTIRYFARPVEPLTFQFILDNPDFETRNLATWLGKNGHSVLYSALLSKDMQSKQTINRAKDADVIITSPDNVSNASVKKAFSSGKSILLINLMNPQAEISNVNRTLGTSLVIRKVSAEPTVPIATGLTALPFQFVPTNRYLIDPKYPIAMERSIGTVGVSLLSETFPLLLSGDSLSYQNVWNTILASIHPASRSNIEVNAPVNQYVLTDINLNNFERKLQMLRIGADSVFVNSSTINSKSSTARFRPTEKGWVSLTDSLNSDIYVQQQAASGDALAVKDFIRSYSLGQPNINQPISEQAHQGAGRKPFDWVWFGVLILCFTLVWVERKL